MEEDGAGGLVVNPDARAEYTDQWRVLPRGSLETLMGW